MQRTVAVAIGLVVAMATLPAAGAGTAGTAQAQVDCEYPVTVTDATGEAVTISEKPDRVVVLGPSAAQTIWAIDAQESVVGMPVNQYTENLPGAAERTNVVGERGTPVQETIVGLEADLVLAPNIIQNETIRNLRSTGLTVYRFEESRSLEGIAAKTERTGRLVGEFRTAASVAAQFQETVETVRSAVKDRERPRAFYVLGYGWSAGQNTFIDDLLQSAGARNVVAEAGVDGYKEISQEVIVERDPEVLVVPDGIPIPRNAAFNGTTAIAEGNIVRVDANKINQPAPRTTEVLENLTRAFHPDVYESIDFDAAESPSPTQCQGNLASPTATASGETATATATDDSATATETTITEIGTEQTPTETPGAEGPGFTAILAVLAGTLFVLINRP